MKKIIAAFCLSFFASFSSAAVINFDDLPGNPADTISDGYQSFNWGIIGSISSGEIPDSGFEAGVVSANNAAYNQYGLDASIFLSVDGTFEFIGAFFTAAWIGDYFHEITFEGLLNGALMYSLDSSIALASDTPTWIQLDWAGIDQLNIYSNLAGWDMWVMDDFTVNIHAASVPESSAVMLMLLGLAGLGFSRRIK